MRQQTHDADRWNGSNVGCHPGGVPIFHVQVAPVEFFQTGPCAGTVGAVRRSGYIVGACRLRRKGLVDNEGQVHVLDVSRLQCIQQSAVCVAAGLVVEQSGQLVDLDVPVIVGALRAEGVDKVSGFVDAVVFESSVEEPEAARCDGRPEPLHRRFGHQRPQVSENSLVECRGREGDVGAPGRRRAVVPQERVLYGQFEFRVRGQVEPHPVRCPYSCHSLPLFFSL